MTMVNILLVNIFEYLKEDISGKLCSIEADVASSLARLAQITKERQTVMESNCEDRVEKIFDELSQQRIAMEARHGRNEKQVSSYNRLETECR